MELPAATKPTNANFVRVIRKNVQWIKVVPNDSIGTCSSKLYSFNLLKLPPPPRAAILVMMMTIIMMTVMMLMTKKKKKKKMKMMMMMMMMLHLIPFLCRVLCFIHLHITIKAHQCNLLNSVAVFFTDLEPSHLQCPAYTRRRRSSANRLLKTVYPAKDEYNT